MPRARKASIDDKIRRISELIGSPSDLRVFPVDHSGQSCLVYLVSLADDKTVQRGLQIAGSLGSQMSQEEQGTGNSAFRPNATLEDAVDKLLEGHVLWLDQGSNLFSIESSGWLKRQPQEPQTERLIRGPREGFTETLEENIGMVRRWIRDPHLRVEEVRVGRRTKTRVAILYLTDVAQARLVAEVRRRIGAIDVDGVLESGYIEQLIADRRASIFPLIQSTERGDRVASAILEGRVAILVDKSPSSLIVPVTINELYQTPEDFYFSFWVGSFLRLIRLLGNNLAVALPGLYIALAVFHPELLPTQWALAIAGTRTRVPVPLIIEVIILEVAVELFREAGLRLPGIVGQPLAVVSGIVLGLTSVQAGFVSPATLVVVALAAIASFSGPNYSVGFAWRLLKFFMIAAAAMFGLYGLTLGGMLILILAADVKSFGVSYLAPWGPLQWNELGDGPVRKPFWARWHRPETYRPQDELRSGGTRREDDAPDE